MASTSPSPHSPRPHIPLQPRLVLALRDTPIIWASTLRYPAPALSLLARLPSYPPFLARIAPCKVTSSAAVVSYRTHLQLTPSFLIVRTPSSSSSPPKPVVGLLPLYNACISQSRPGVLSFAGILLEPHPRDFSAVAAALSRALAKPAPPAVSRFELLNKLAVGPRANVYAVRDRTNGERLALKLLRRPEDPTELVAWRVRLVHDRAILHRVRGHPFILDLRHAALLPDAAALFFEHCPQDLFNFMRLRGAPLTEQEAIAVVAQLLLAIFRVHAAGGAVTAGPGRGLRPDNILLDDHGWVRLASFGYCSLLNRGLLDDAHLFRKQTVAAKKSSRRERREDTGEQTENQKSLKHKTENTAEVVDSDVNNKDAMMSSRTGVEKAARASASRPQQSGNDLTEKSQKGQHNTLQKDVAIGSPSAGVNAKAAEANSALSADLWSLGALSHFALTGEFPLQESSAFFEHSVSTSDDHERKRSSVQDPGISPAIESDAARDFIGGLLRTDPAARLGCGVEGLVALQKHPWLADILWQELERRQGPYALRIEKHRDIDLLDIGERDIRETFSSSALLDRLSHRDSRRRKLSSLFSWEFRGRRESDENGTSSDEQTLSKGSSELILKDRKVACYNDEGFVFGFGFTSTGPAFSPAVWPGKQLVVERGWSGRLEGGRRRRWSGPSKGRQASGAARIVR